MTAGGHIRADRLRATESLYGPTRSARPSDTRGDTIICPFCPGNEHLTAPLLTADPGVGWQSRVIANLYPAVVEPDGRHEVIVELRDHDPVWTALGAGELERILRAYREREAAAYADGYAYATVFKNCGGRAGASLRHPHAQVVALRAIPASIAARIERLTSTCNVCVALSDGGARVVLRTPEVVAYVPDGSRSAFEVRLAPVVHAAVFSETSPATHAAVAGVLAGVLKRLAATLGERMPFNLIVQSAPRAGRAHELMHWEIEIVPRVESFGGYEVGTGGFLVSRTPEVAAEILRAAGERVPARA
jgi:UDPglucose--hexose-1-phosphate uridylyltransferase